MVSGDFIDRVVAFINSMTAYMKDMSHTVLIFGDPGCIDEETDKNLNINGLDTVYRENGNKLTNNDVRELGATHAIGYDLDFFEEAPFTCDVYVAFTKYPMLSHATYLDNVIVASDVEPHGPVMLVTPLPMRYRPRVNNTQEKIKHEYRKHNKQALVSWEEIRRDKEMSILAVSVKRMIRGLYP